MTTTMMTTTMTTTIHNNKSLNVYCPDALIDLIIPFFPPKKLANDSKHATTPLPFLTPAELRLQIATVSHWQLYLIFLALVVCSSGVAQLSKWVVKNLQREQECVDTEFDAGRDATSGTSASAIVSYWTWAATLLQSTTVTVMYGISGAYWYAAGACIQLLVFSIITVQLKVKAPGAKTYLQIIRARFDKRTHLTFCTFALMTNFVVTAMLMLGGATVLTSLVDGLTVETGTLLITATVFTYTFVGGLNATMYVSYFNSAIMFSLVLVFLVRVFYSTQDGIGSIKHVYSTVTCLRGPEGNKDNSYLTFSSLDGFIFGLINIVGNFGAVIIDQSYWQCAVAAKPFSAAGGFLTAGLIWFAIPFCFGSTMGLAYKSMQVMDFNKTGNWRALSDDQINQGLVAPYVATRLLGNSGSLMCVILVIMAVTSTGASQIIAVTSVLVYDVYQFYLKPYRMVFNCNTCLLCGCEKGRKAHAQSKNICRCLSMTACKDCLSDNKVRSLESKRKAVKAAFTCSSHGPYRTYSEYVQRVKNWFQVIFTIAILPLTLVLHYTTISLGWVYSFMGIVIGSSVVPVVLTLSWTGLDGRAMSLGAICGPFLGFLAMLIGAEIRPGGLYYFLENTGNEMSMLAGNVVSIASGAIITILASLILNRNGRGEDKKEVWEMTRDIDNPLRPWTELYAKDLNLEPTDLLDSRPTLEMMERKYKPATYMAVSISVLATFFLLVVWPAVALSLETMDLSAFTRWIHLITAVTFSAAVYIIILPPIAEFIRIRSTLNEKNRIDDAVSAPKRIPTRTVSSQINDKRAEDDQMELDFDNILKETGQKMEVIFDNALK